MQDVRGERDYVGFDAQKRLSRNSYVSTLEKKVLLRWWFETMEANLEDRLRATESLVKDRGCVNSNINADMCGVD